MLEEDRRNYTPLIEVIEERLDNFKEENRRDHEMIMRKIDAANEVKARLSMVIESNRWRDWAVRLLYSGGVIILIVEIIKSRLK